LVVRGLADRECAGRGATAAGARRQARGRGPHRGAPRRRDLMDPGARMDPRRALTMHLLSSSNKARPRAACLAVALGLLCAGCGTAESGTQTVAAQPTSTATRSTTTVADATST